MVRTGVVYKLGNNINTDMIIPARYLILDSLDELSAHVFEFIDKSFPEKAKKEKIILVAGKNFGCGSSREQAASVLKHLNVNTIIAESFSRIFKRNALLVGILLIEIEDSTIFDSGDILQISEKGLIKILGKESIVKGEIVKNV
jgi:3-isopropylmalate dehydratase small subunit